MHNIDLDPCEYRESGPIDQQWQQKGKGDNFMTCRHPILKWPGIGVDERVCLQCQSLSLNGEIYGPPNPSWRRQES